VPVESKALRNQLRREEADSRAHLEEMITSTIGALILNVHTDTEGGTGFGR
jgi:hypothetical protein